MSAGLAWDEPSPVRRTPDDDQTPLLWTGSLYATVFGREAVARPGERFVYSGGLTSVLVDVIESMPAMLANCCSRGVATADAIVSGLAPGRPAEMEMVGKSTFGRSLTGSLV